MNYKNICIVLSIVILVLLATLMVGNNSRGNQAAGVITSDAGKIDMTKGGTDATAKPIGGTVNTAPAAAPCIPAGFYFCVNGLLATPNGWGGNSVGTFASGLSNLTIRWGTPTGWHDCVAGENAGWTPVTSGWSGPVALSGGPITSNEKLPNGLTGTYKATYSLTCSNGTTTQSRYIKFDVWQ